VFRTLVEKIEEALAKRKAAPGAVSRSAVAQPLMQALRAEIKDKDDAAMAGAGAKRARPAARRKAEAAHA
jgi:hypothetical protein